MTTDVPKKFEADKYLTKLQGRDYLEVKWRLLWLRTEHPEAVVNTELVLPPSQLTGKDGESFALFKATVSIPGAGSATGWGSETAKDFRDYIEKAETKALGRALAALGFGTQFAYDVEDPRPSESPTEHLGEGRTSPSPFGTAPEGKTSARSSEPITPAQIRAIYSIARGEHGLSDKQVEAMIEQHCGSPIQGLSRRQASEWIETLKTGELPGAPAEGGVKPTASSDSPSAGRTNPTEGEISVDEGGSKPAPGQTGSEKPTARGPVATPAQVRAIYSIAREKYGADEEQTEEDCRLRYGCKPEELTKAQASELIATLQQGKAR